jgi:hypothetical protein
MRASAHRKSVPSSRRVPAAAASTALIAARRALQQQTALVAQLEVQVRTLTAARALSPRKTAIVPADTEIYWRTRHFNR